MARAAKKQKELTPEEKLAQALVPVEEQPYPIPENWCWTTLHYISSHISDGSHNPPKNSGKGIPLLSAKNIHNRIIDYNNVDRWILEDEWIEENKRTLIAKGDVLITIVATIGRVAVVSSNVPFALQRSVATIKPLINSYYLSYYLESPYVQFFMNENAKGTAQKGFYLKALDSLYCAVPPLAEQQRIVDRIESLFSKLDEAKEKAQSVIDSYEDRKSAILHQAFSGELTKEWRGKNCVTLDDWKYKYISEFAEVKGGKRLPKGTALIKEKTAHPYLRVTDFSENTINTSDLHYITDDVYSQIDRYIINSTDVYISIVGTIGKCGTIPESLNGANLTENAARIISEETTPRYLAKFLSSPSAQEDIKCRIRSATLGKLSITNIKKIMVPLPSIKEQEVIAEILDELFKKETKAKHVAEQTLVQIEETKKQILADAFRGKLGTNSKENV